MNRRGFLDIILRAGVSAAILPPALTYARQWTKPVEAKLFRPSDYWNGEDVSKFNRLPFYLVELETRHLKNWKPYAEMFGDIKWQPNMGSVLRGAKFGS